MPPCFGGDELVFQDKVGLHFRVPFGQDHVTSLNWKERHVVELIDSFLEFKGSQQLPMLQIDGQNSSGIAIQRSA